MLHNHPLDQLIHDDSLFFLEAMIPFVDYAYKKPLILLIKYQEIRALMQCFDHPDYVASCGFDCHPESSEEMMECMCRFLPGDFAGNIKNMQQMLKMMQVMQAMNDSGSQGTPPNNNCGNPCDFPPQPGCGAPPPPPDYAPRQDIGRNPDQRHGYPEFPINRKVLLCLNKTRNFETSIQPNYELSTKSRSRANTSPPRSCCRRSCRSIRN